MKNLRDEFFLLEAIRDEGGQVVDWLYRDANDAVLQVLDVRREELIGARVSDLLRATTARTQERWKKVLETGMADSHERSFHGGDYLFRVFRIGDATIGSAALDITERKRNEDALRESEAALRESEAALREADRRKNEFIARLSHELRNPLAPIKNGLYVLEHARPGSDQARQAQSVISRQVDQLARLVDDLLDITRISLNRIRLDRRPLDLNEHVRRTVEDYRSLFESKGVKLEVVLAAAPVIVEGDWVRLEEVIGNILQNAAKFTRRDGTTRVELQSESSAQRAVLRIADNGLGMTRETLARLFQPFVQADQAVNYDAGGLGLGLALVKGIVELHGGDISATSPGPGKGAELLVRLPLAPELPTAVRLDRAGPPGVRRRILIIEDNVDAAESLRTILEFDHEVALAHSGAEGLQKARTFQPDIVLCDIGLPGMNGHEVARAFRADETLKETFLVALSGHALPEDLGVAASAGFDRYFAKPPDLQELEAFLASGDIQRPAPAAARIDAATMVKSEAIVAHDLRQPLLTIELCAESLAQTSGAAIGSAEAKAIEHIRNATAEMRAMIGDLLDSALLDAQELTLSRELLPLAALVEQVVAQQAKLAPERPIAVEKARDLHTVMADWARIERVLGNILSNAIKYGRPHSQIAVTVLQRGHDIEVAITHEGAPLTPEEARRIFDRFNQSESPDAGRRPGGGIGLYVARRLVEVHGGRLWVESGGERTTFRFTLPAVDLNHP